ncbi:MAG: hypothetical protein ACLTL5_11425, partial [Oscillospiraceae bacterium]
HPPRWFALQRKHPLCMKLILRGGLITLRLGIPARNDAAHHFCRQNSIYHYICQQDFEQNAKK